MIGRPVSGFQEKAVEASRVRAMSRRSLLAFGLALPALGACSTAGSGGRPDLRTIYNRSAQHHGPDRNPIIVIPGILGSRLVDASSRQTIWGAFNGQAASPSNPADARRIALPLDGTVGERSEADYVMPEGVLDRVNVRLAGVPVELRQYAQILATLGAGGYRDQSLGLGGVDYGDDHFTCFQFAYDWRRDNAENAGELRRFMDAKRAYLVEKYRERFSLETDPDSIKFDVVTHSMGGLLLRYFLKFGDQSLAENGPDPRLNWAGAAYVDRAILVAPPNAGSALSLRYLVEGQDLGRPVLPFYPPAILGSFPSMYQLLPRGAPPAFYRDAARTQPVADLHDPDLWRQLNWGLADPGQAGVLAALMPGVTDPGQRAAVALTRQASLLKLGKRFQAAIDTPAAAPPGLDAFLVAGDTLPTEAAYAPSLGGRKLQVVRMSSGDGSVTRASAQFDERTEDDWTPRVRSRLRFRSVLMVSGDHLGLTRSATFSDNVLYWLLEEPRDGARLGIVL